MTHKELRQFIKDSNREGLTPIEKDVFLYYYSCTRNDENSWFCSDAEVAAEIERSRNGVCSARKSLKKRGWITEKTTFHIKVVRDISVRNQTDESEIRLKPVKTSLKSDSGVRNQTESVDSQSEIRLVSPKSDSSVRNQTEKAQISVRNQTPYKDKKKLRVEEEIKKGKEEGETRPPARELPVAISIYQEIYPTSIIDGNRLEIFEKRLPEVEESVWRQTLLDWQLNGYRSGNISGMISRYEKNLEVKANAHTNGNKPKSNAERLKQIQQQEIAVFGKIITNN